MLNLEKVRAFTRPVKVEKIYLCGEIQEVEIHVASHLQMMAVAKLDVEKDRKEMVVSLVSAFLDISPEDSLLIIEKDFPGAMEIVSVGRKLTDEWNEKYSKEMETAKKNLNPELMNTHE